MSLSLVLLVAIGCVSVEPEAIEVVLSADPDTVIEVSWSTAASTRGWVEYGSTEAFGSTTTMEVEPGTAHRQAILGLPPDTSVYLRVVTEDENGRRGEGPIYETRTGRTPSDLPPIDTALVPDVQRPWGCYTLVSWYSLPQGRSAAVVLDRDGNVVWYHEVDGECLSTAFSRDRTAVLMLWSPGGDDSVIERVPLDGSAVTRLDVPLAHHDFVERDDGVLAVIASEFRDVGGTPIRGDRLLEVDPEGATREVWNAFDELPVEENDGWAQSPPDWTHANGIGWDATTGLYVLSLYRQELLVGIDAATGETRWTFGDGGDFTLANDAGFGPQHNPELRDGKVLFFDNAAETGLSRVVEYALDTDAFVATRTWELPSPLEERTQVLGDGDRLPGGGTITAWGENREVLTVTEEGEVVRSVVLGEPGDLVGAVERANSLYPSDATFPEP